MKDAAAKAGFADAVSVQVAGKYARILCAAVPHLRLRSAGPDSSQHTWLAHCKSSPRTPPMRARARCSSRGRSSRCTTAARSTSSADPRRSRTPAPRIAVGVVHQLGDRVIERATARHATVLGERRRLRELGHQLGLTLVPPFRRLKARARRHTGRFSGARRSTFMQLARRVERDTAPAPPGARCACRARGRGNYAAFLRPAAAYVTGVKVGASASDFRNSQGVCGAVRLLSALSSPTQCGCRGVTVFVRRGFRPWQRGCARGSGKVHHAAALRESSPRGGSLRSSRPSSPPPGRRCAAQKEEEISLFLRLFHISGPYGTATRFAAFPFIVRVMAACFAQSRTLAPRALPSPQTCRGPAVAPPRTS